MTEPTWQDRALLAEGKLSVLREEIERLHDVIAAKDEAILGMKREGFMPPAPVGEQPKGTDIEVPEVILDAIDRLAEQGSQAHSALVREAQRELRHVKDDDPEAAKAHELIAKGILEGNTHLSPHHL